jgi:hypothetical protein
MQSKLIFTTTKQATIYWTSLSNAYVKNCRWYVMDVPRNSKPVLTTRSEQ